MYMSFDMTSVFMIYGNKDLKAEKSHNFSFSYAFAHEKIEKGQPQLSSTRPHAATARVEYGKSWKKYGFNIALNGRFLSKLTANEYISLTSYEETQKVTYPAYTIWKLSLMQTFRKGLSLIVGGRQPLQLRSRLLLQQFALCDRYHIFCRGFGRYQQVVKQKYPKIRINADKNNNI